MVQVARRRSTTKQKQHKQWMQRWWLGGRRGVLLSTHSMRSSQSKLKHKSVS